MARQSNELIDISCILRHETEKAYLLDIGEEKPVWVPKSMCECEFDEEGNGTVTLPEWLALDKGMI